MYNHFMSKQLVRWVFFLVSLICIVYFCLYHLSFVSLKYMYIHVHKSIA